MTRIEWLLKGDPLYSLQVARRTAIAVPRGSYTTRESTGPDLEKLAELGPGGDPWTNRPSPPLKWEDGWSTYPGQRAVQP
tara:strand:+ start:726 stop:965 length:240 start_codon:yes stop_codon:yes gene_type:complete